MRRTETSDDDARTAATTPVHAYFVRVLSYDEPTRRPARWSLDDVTAIEIGGGERTEAVRSAGTLAITCDDTRVSSRHARIERRFGRWILEDAGSKNGTFVGGVRVSRHQLEDADLIEIGRTVFCFRELDAPVRDAVARIDERFFTLHAPLEAALARAVESVRVGLPVLVVGETGVGKERFVAACHDASLRSGALVAINCAALPSTLVEAELFGHRRGAFSGATDDRPGYLRAADRGTVFLDEIGDMPLPSQAALLRALAERAVTPVGEERAIPIDVAVISATHRDPAALSAAGTFRADLLARLRGMTIELPSLRERPEDIGAFVARTLARVAPSASLAVDAGRRILTAPWLLNVRELEHAIAAAAVRAGERPIASADLPEVPAPPRPAAPLSDEDAALRARLVEALAAHGGNISAVARALGRDRKQIHRWIARFQLR